ncbi:BatD family protein [Sunxiuqinia elliptica]|uniref:Oxygen tolerance protein BatD n=1 Tax=Sunxiuqinia elliptica TaxID=655355 RepID=A0A4V3BXV1_9BACT|nr:BatD family protein [Sunxiuqinia elliptica]TDO00069.1 oxygen tolerance protein BatD [Sunxiuqinia elliptica]TDO57260.1 oxygen tolerance protein BatD [Sunxiuqinia elliptica]
MIKKILVTLMLLIPAFYAGADSVRFNMSGPNVVTVGEQFRLSFTLNERGSDLQMPEIPNFDILMGPSTSQSSSIQIINGKTTQTVSFSYIFILRAKEEGTFTIRPASIKVDGKIYESNELKIQVVKGQKPATSQGGQQEQAAAASGSINKEDLFVKVELDKRRVFKGEQILATVKIYVAPNVPITSFNDVKLPSYAGFWTQEIDIPNQISFTREVYNNKIYQVGILKKTLLFPQQTGKITIDPFEITCLVRQRVRQQRSFFDDFFDNYRTIEAKVVSDPVNIQVKDLPNPPASFSGAVGNLKFSASLDKEQLKSNEAATLKVTISGNGNLRLIDAPKVEFPADFEVYDPKTNESLNATSNGLTGSKTFEYLFIPRFAGEYTIPAIQFASFDPASGKYKYDQSKAFNLQVEKGSDDQSTTVTSAYSKEDVRFIGKDIRFIKQGQYKLKPKESSFYGSLSFYLIYLGALLVFAIVALVYRKKLKENANIQLIRNKKANKVARKRLKAAAGHLKQNQDEAFYEAVLKAFWGYLSDKLSIPVADLNRENATESLKKRQVSSDTINEFIQIVDTCEFARYAPSAVGGTKDELFQQAASLMGKLEKQIR